MRRPIASAIVDLWNCRHRTRTHRRYALLRQCRGVGRIDLCSEVNMANGATNRRTYAQMRIQVERRINTQHEYTFLYIHLHLHQIGISRDSASMQASISSESETPVINVFSGSNRMIYSVSTLKPQ